MDGSVEYSVLYTSQTSLIAVNKTGYTCICQTF